MKSYEFKYQATKFSEKVQRKIVWAMPRKLVMWAFIRVVSHATTGKWSNQVVPELGAMEALERWDNPKAPQPIHPNLVDANNYIKWAKRLEQKQGYARVIEWSRLPKTIKINGVTHTLEYGDIDDGVYLSYANRKKPAGTKGSVFMHYEESTLRDCITKAYRKIAESGIPIKIQ